MRITYAKIYLNNLRHNITLIKSFTNPAVKTCIAVKADGYGHGAVQVSKVAQECGVNYLAVATVDEGVELRNANITLPILVLSLCTPQEFTTLFEYNLTPFVGDKEYIEMLISEAQKCKVTNFEVHLAVDTGMGRIGCLSKDAGTLAKLINSSNELKFGGICTHFCSADGLSKENQEYANNQYKDFLQAVENVKNAGVNPGIRHCSSSAALVDHKEWQLDMVRAGIITYGYYPDEITENYLAQKGTPMDLKPVMALVSGVSVIRPFAPGKSISYGHTWTATENTDIAVLPIGYADGLLRRFSPGLKVAINGKAYPVRGRICMDQCMVDIGLNNHDVKRFDEAIIFGPPESGALQTAGTLATDIGTISYEVLTGITKRVSRIYVEG